MRKRLTKARLSLNCQDLVRNIILFNILINQNLILLDEMVKSTTKFPKII